MWWSLHSKIEKKLADETDIWNPASSLSCTSLNVLSTYIVMRAGERSGEREAAVPLSLQSQTGSVSSRSGFSTATCTAQNRSARSAASRSPSYSHSFTHVYLLCTGTLQYHRRNKLSITQIENRKMFGKRSLSLVLKFWLLNFFKLNNI